jgi:hypothetical protein
MPRTQAQITLSAFHHRPVAKLRRLTALFLVFCTQMIA